MFNILSYQRNANENNPKIPSYTSQNAKDQKLKQHLMLVKFWSKKKKPALVTT